MIGRMLLIRAFQNPVRIGGQMNVRIFAEMHLRHIVLPHVADDPDVRQVGNGERVRRRQRLHAGLIGDLLVGDDSRTGANTSTMPVGWSGSTPSSPRCSLAGFEIDHGCRPSAFCAISRALFGIAPCSNRSVGAVELDLRQFLVLDGLAVIGKRARDVGAAHFEQKLALLHFIAQPRVDFHDSPGGERRHRHLPRHIRIDHAGHIQLRRGNVLARRRQRKLLRMVHLEIVGVQVRLHG